MADSPDRTDTTEVPRPEWFAAFLADRGTRKPSAHTRRPTARTSTRSPPSSPAARMASRGWRWAMSRRTRCARRSRNTRRPMKPRRFNGVGRPGMCVGAACGQPDAVGRPPQAREDAAEGSCRQIRWPRCWRLSMRTLNADPQPRRRGRTRPRPYPHRAAGRPARR